MDLTSTVVTLISILVAAVLAFVTVLVARNLALRRRARHAGEAPRASAGSDEPPQRAARGR